MSRNNTIPKPVSLQEMRDSVRKSLDRTKAASLKRNVHLRRIDWRWPRHIEVLEALLVKLEDDIRTENAP